LAGLSSLPFDRRWAGLEKWRFIVADNPNAKHAEALKEAADKRIAENKSAREQQVKDAPEQGKPTPTQEENDQAALGVHVLEKEPDGSPEQQPFAQTLQGGGKQHHDKQAAAKTPTPNYQTRASRPADV
jgi:nitroreductase